MLATSLKLYLLQNRFLENYHRESGDFVFSVVVQKQFVTPNLLIMAFGSIHFKGDLLSIHSFVVLPTSTANEKIHETNIFQQFQKALSGYLLTNEKYENSQIEI